MFWKNKNVLVTGGDGFLGRNLVPKLKESGADVFVPLIEEFDLTKETDVDRVFATYEPDIVIHLAADLGSVTYMKSHAAQMFFNNILMNTLLMEKSRVHNVKKFIGINTVNCYPHNADVPFKEADLWEGNPDEHVLGYGVPKRMMIMQSLLYHQQHGFNAVNLIIDSIYGPHDVFTPEKARVIPANIMRCLDAKQRKDPFITVWGTGRSERDYVYVEDAVRAILFAAEKINTPEPVNIGTGSSITIKRLIELIAEITGFAGEIRWDTSKPDGQLKRYLDTTKAKELGFVPSVSFRQGLEKTVTWYLSQ